MHRSASRGCRTSRLSSRSCCPSPRRRVAGLSARTPPVTGWPDGRRAVLRLGYVLKRFPRLSETFILNEIVELEAQGVEVEVFALLEPAEEVQHEILRQVRGRVTYLPQASY